VEDAEVFGHISLLHFAGFHQFGHIQRPRAQGLEQGEAAGLGQDAKETGDGNELFGGKRRFFGC
jgi:hypothetical protein